MQRLRVFLVQLANQNLLYKSQQFMPDMRVVKVPALKPYVGLLTFSAISLAVALGITLQKYITFEYHSNAGVVGWLSANAYPKQQEYFFYLLALLGIPIAIYLYWFGWCVYSRWCAKLTAQPVARVLKANALASIPLGFCWLQVYYIGQGTLIGLLLPIAVSVLLKLVLLYKRYFPALWNSNILDDTGESENAATLTDEESGKTSFGNHRLLKFGRIGLEYVILPIFIYLLTYSASLHGNIDMFHEGERLAPLNEMLHGGVPFRDVYVQHGLFQNAYLAWFGSLFFEPTLFGVRLMEDILAPLGYVAFYLLGLQVFRGRFLTAFLCMLIASGTAFWVSPRHSLGLISFAFVANFLTHSQSTSKGSPFSWKLLLAGIFTSLAFWYSTEIGLYTLGGIGLFLSIYGLQKGMEIWKRPFPLINYSCGLLLGFLPIAAYFFSHGALDDAIWNSYIQCRYQLATWGLAFPSLSKTIGLLSTEGWHAFIFSEGFRWYLPICIFLIIAAYLTYRGLSGTHSANTMKLLLLLLGGIAFFRTALGRSDGGHLIYGATFLWLLCLLPLEGGIVRMCRVGLSSLRGQRPWHAAVKAAWVLIPIVIFCWYVGERHHPLVGFNGKWQRLRQNPFKQSTVAQELVRAGAVDIPDDQVEQIQKVVAYIKENTAENEKIFDFTSQGAYYFFANRPGVSRFHQVSYASTLSMQQEVIEALEKDKTRLVIFKTGGWFDAVDGIPVEERHPLIAAYLQANYELAVNINNTEILLRK
ncbi:hypothetical protein F4054_15675 [Candidatus Poribacteria bacterium]|nr:hypothetical protein [Candidatus Poribacteria bacterium]MYG07022.1 hypothetical protein [Candidatus Poribacteria bacterium]MYK23682.1 hypothetical protein [Candidatus Poribacteria bacterium]